jgi:hypothetical protein
MNWITVISIFISTIATCFIAYYSKVSTNLAKEIKNQDKNYRENLESLSKQHQDQLSDLYQAIVIATLMGGSSNTGVVNDLIKTFSGYYNGKTKIFE